MKLWRGFMKNNAPIRVLQIFNTMIYGGAESFIMNVYRNLDRNKIQFDFLVHGRCVFEDEIEEMGGRIYHIPGYITALGPRKYAQELKSFFNKNRWDIIHCHLDKTSGFIVNTIKKVYSPVFISHSHCCGEENSIVVKVYKKHLKSLLNKKADYKIACSDNAGKWLFGNDYVVVRNPIDLKRFVFDAKKRLEVRRNLGLSENDFVMGTVGRLEPIKNHSFLLDVFNEYQKRDKRAKLVIVGNGSMLNEVRDKIKELKLSRKIYIIEPCNDIEKYYSAFDLFIMPSKSEGLGMVLLEAAANFLPILTTDNVPKEIIEDVKAVSITNYDADEWASKIDKINKEREEKTERLIVYDARRIAERMERIYLEEIEL